jgi:hypothetical protein
MMSNTIAKGGGGAQVKIITFARMRAVIWPDMIDYILPCSRQNQAMPILSLAFHLIQVNI